MPDATDPATPTDAIGTKTTDARHEVPHESEMKESTRKSTTTVGSGMNAHRKNDHGPNAHETNIHGTNIHGTSIHETDGRVTTADLIQSIGPQTRGHGATNVDFHTRASAILSKPDTRM
ncbi:MAG: hypothetical protein ACOVQN_03315 [Exiguobacterium sp.]